MITRNSMFKNKKADTAVTILVLLTVALCVICLFYFYISEKNRETEIVTFGTLNDFYVQAGSLEYFIGNLAKDIMVNNPDMNEMDFLDEFKKQFAGSYWNVEPGAVHKIREGSYDVKIKDKILYFNIKDFPFESNYERKNWGIYSINYQKDMSFTIFFG